MQLHQVQEELEYYFLQNQELLEEKTKRSNVFDFIQSDSFELDIHEFIKGDNWYHAEDNGCWAGPNLKSTIQLPQFPPGKYQIELTIADVMSPAILDHLTATLNHLPLNLERLSPSSNPTAFPCALIAQFEISDSIAVSVNELRFHFIETISPSSTGGDDYNP